MGEKKHGVKHGVPNVQCLCCGSTDATSEHRDHGAFTIVCRDCGVHYKIACEMTRLPHADALIEAGHHIQLANTVAEPEHMDMIHMGAKKAESNFNAGYVDDHAEHHHEVVSGLLQGKSLKEFDLKPTKKAKGE